MSTPDRWHLMKHDDGTVFGPVAFEQIKEWAKAAQVSPLDKISSDELNWTKAPMFAELEMDWLLQMSDDHYYGPTTLSAIQEFIKEGEIDHETLVINCKDATQTRVGELPFRVEEPAPLIPGETDSDEDDVDEGTFAERLLSLEATVATQQARIEHLEEALKDFLTPR
ncbi:MAG TPA: hypothetical protein VF585_02950 [Chthoniobacterales bacterium]|jgi:hypothetical protein